MNAGLGAMHDGGALRIGKGKASLTRVAREGIGLAVRGAPIAVASIIWQPASYAPNPDTLRPCNSLGFYLAVYNTFNTYVLGGIPSSSLVHHHRNPLPNDVRQVNKLLVCSVANSMSYLTMTKVRNHKGFDIQPRGLTCAK